MNRTSTYLAIVAAFGFMGCGGTEKRPTVAPSVPAAEAPRTPPQRTARAEGSDRAAVHVSDEIQRACGLDLHEAYFDYDSARIRADQRAILRKLADCFSTGPLRGRTMALIGRADPRGDAEYNMLLGERRASAVASGLAAEQLARRQMQTSSRGEMDARGV
ncbi:MAG: OmpA family protein, partial [Polyangiaceae bacterium]|nr:OmpA family protein [Polyangiaceae bacterium]